MSISPNLTYCADLQLYRLYRWRGITLDPSILNKGLLALLCVGQSDTLNFSGGALPEFDTVAISFWVEILEIQEDTVIGKTKEKCNLFQAGSIFHFKACDINKLMGWPQWNIDHLSVLVSEKIVNRREAVGYFYYFEMGFWSFDRVYYAVSEVSEPKENIHLIKIPLASLIDIDPIMGSYLEPLPLQGMVRADAFTFKEYDLPERDQSVYPVNGIFLEDDDLEEYLD